jgi:hypothetical protein
MDRADGFTSYRLTDNKEPIMFCPFIIAGHDGECVTLQFHFDPLHRSFAQVALSARAARSLAADLLYLAGRLDDGDIRVGLTPPLAGDVVDWDDEEEEEEEEFRGSD